MAKTPKVWSLLIQCLGASACAELARRGYHPSHQPPQDPFDIPQGAVAKISIIDSTLRVNKLPSKDLVLPQVPGFDFFPTTPAWSFFVESSTGERAIFDLGVPPNFTESFSPALAERIQAFGWDVSVEKHVVDVLREHGVSPKTVGSIIWSHSHWDHIGDPSTFPSSTDLIVGPGFKENMLPAYPTDPKSLVKESYFEGRNLVEIDFTSNAFKIGEFPAHDFFGDGSFYLLDAPGHAVGHMAALVRTTTNPDTFMLLGGDLCHHGAEIRPSLAVPFPPRVQDHYTCPEAVANKISGECPGAAEFKALNIEIGRDADGPALFPAIYTNLTQAVESIERAQPADARDDIFVVWAHDTNINGTVDQFPLLANDWKRKGWKEKVHWEFLADLAPGAANLTGQR